MEGQEGGLGEKIYIYIYAPEKLTQNCKAIFHQLKNRLKKKVCQYSTLHFQWNNDRKFKGIGFWKLSNK